MCWSLRHDSLRFSFALDRQRTGFGRQCVITGLLEQPLLSRHLIQLAERRQVLQILESEDFEKTTCGSIEHGAAGDFTLSRNPNQLSIEQALDRRAGIDAANLFDFGACRGLAIGDDGERLEGCLGKPQGPLLLELLEIARELGTRSNLVATCDLPDFEGAILFGIFRIELVDEILRLACFAIGNDFGQFYRGNRFRRGENQSFDDPALLAGFHSTHCDSSSLPSAALISSAMILFTSTP